MSTRSDEEKRRFMQELRLLIECYENTKMKSDDSPRKAAHALAAFVLKNKDKVVETLQRHADFRTHEEWKHDEDEAWFDEEYD